MYEIALALSVLCLVGVVFFFVRSAAFSVFHPLTWYIAFHGLLFVFRPIVARIMDFQVVYRGYRFVPSASDKLTVILASNLGFLVFAACCWRVGNVAMRFKQDHLAISERERLKPLFLWAAAICVPIGLYSLTTVWNGVSESGVGYADMVMDPGTGAFINTKNVGYVVEAQLMLATCGAVFAWLFRFRLLALLPLIAFVVLKAGTGGRGPFVTALATVGLLYLYEHRRRIFSWKAALAVGGAMILFATVGNDRGATIRRMVGSDTSSTVFYQTRGNERFLEGMDFANLEYFEYLVYAIPQRTHTYGYFLDTLQIFTEPVPRVWWKNKPVGAPFERIHLFEYGNPMGMTRSVPGEGWYSLGWAGVAIWCALWGWCLGRIYRAYVQSDQSTLKTASYMIFLPVLIVAYRDGSPITILRQGLFFFMPIVVWHLFRRSTRVPSLSTVRAAALRGIRARRTKAPSPANESVEAGRWLPPAVRRRRAALAGAGPDRSR